MTQEHAPIDDSYANERTQPDEALEVPRLKSQVHVTRGTRKSDMPPHLYVSYPDRDVTEPDPCYDYVRYVNVDVLPLEVKAVVDAYFAAASGSSGSYARFVAAADALRERLDVSRHAGRSKMQP